MEEGIKQPQAELPKEAQRPTATPLQSGGQSQPQKILDPAQKGPSKPKRKFLKRIIIFISGKGKTD